MNDKNANTDLIDAIKNDDTKAAMAAIRSPDFSEKRALENHNEAFRLAAKHGNLTVLEALLAFPEILKHADEDPRESAKTTGGKIFYTALTIAMLTQNMTVLLYTTLLGSGLIVSLLSKYLPDSVLQTVPGSSSAKELSKRLFVSLEILIKKIEQKSALSWAVEEGHSEVVERLLQIDSISRNAASNQNQVLRVASKNGDLQVLNQLLAVSNVTDSLLITPSDVADELPRNLFSMFIAFFATVILYQQFLAGYFPYLNAIMPALPLLATSAMSQYSSFDYFYTRAGDYLSRIIRFDKRSALAEASTQGHLVVVERLLSLPQMQQARVTHVYSALVAAVSGSHEAVATRLRQHPGVRQYEQIHSLERSTGAMAQYFEAEGSTVQAPKHCRDLYQLVKNQYQTTLQQEGVESILGSLMKHLVAKYNENPAQYKGEVLPFQFDPSVSEKAYIRYFENKYHSVYRYLFCDPNPWMSEKANFVHWKNGQGTANIAQEAKEIIAYLWLAANDERRPLPKGFMRESLKDNLIVILSDPARGHNFDEYGTRDDWDKDRPSCSPGVTTRLLQFLILLGFQPLTPKIIHQSFKEQCITAQSPKGIMQKIEGSNETQLLETREALKAFVLNLNSLSDLNPSHLRALDSLSIQSSDLKHFMTYVFEKYSKSQLETAVLWQGERFDTYIEYIRYLAKNVIAEYYNLFSQQVEDRLKALPSSAPSKSPFVSKPNSLLAQCELERRQRRKGQSSSEPLLADPSSERTSTNTARVHST